MGIYKIYADDDGRYIITDVNIGNRRLTMANIYAPNEDRPEYFENIIGIIENIPNDNRIIGGDFNLVLNLEMDKRGGRQQTHTNGTLG